MMQPPSAPGWESAVPVAPVSHSTRSSSSSVVYFVLALLGITLYLGLRIVGFYLGVCWMQHALNELTLSVRDLKSDVSTVLLVLRSDKGGG